MTKTQFMTKASRSIHKLGFKCKKHAPEALVVAGVVGVVTSAVMACKATTKASEITEELKDRMEQIHEVAEMNEGSDRYTEQDQKKDTVIVYTQAAIKFVKLYGPSVALGAASIAAILTSHSLLKKRNVALAAAYTAVEKGFKDYRGRVIERFGEELDKELRYNIKAKEIEETVVDENGNETVVKKTVNVVDPNMNSPYARFFDDGCNGWEKDAAHNMYFLTLQQNHANEKLKKQGYLFLNDVYEMLGIPKTPIGQVIGWIYDEANPIGDNFVDFGIFNQDNEKARDFVNGRERVILLDFNVDGNILDMM